MNEHPQDSIPAFVLGALDPDEAILVGEHLAVCPACRADAEAFRATLGMLPHATEPRPHVKRQLFARIAAGGIPQPRIPAPARPWASYVAALALVVALVCAVVAINARGRAATLAAQLADERDRADTLAARLEQNQQARAMVAFISAPATLRQPLESHDARASAAMYMQRDHTHAVLIVHGLLPAGPGKTYQFWLATDREQVPAGTFDTNPQGMAELPVEAPTPVDQYAQVMVTIEPAGGSRIPSDEVVLEADLAPRGHAPVWFGEKGSWRGSPSGKTRMHVGAFN